MMSSNYVNNFNPSFIIKINFVQQKGQQIKVKCLIYKHVVIILLFIVC